MRCSAAWGLILLFQVGAAVSVHGDCGSRSASVQRMCDAVGPADWGCLEATRSLRQSGCSGETRRAERLSTTEERDLLSKLSYHEERISEITKQLEQGHGGNTGVDKADTPWHRLLAPRGPQGGDAPEQPTCTTEDAVKTLHDAIATNQRIMNKITTQDQCENHQCPQGTKFCQSIDVKHFFEKYYPTTDANGEVRDTKYPGWTIEKLCEEEASDPKVTKGFCDIKLTNNYTQLPPYFSTGCFPDLRQDARFYENYAGWGLPPSEHQKEAAKNGANFQMTCQGGCMEKVKDLTGSRIAGSQVGSCKGFDGKYITISRFPQIRGSGIEAIYQTLAITDRLRLAICAGNDHARDKKKFSIRHRLGETLMYKAIGFLQGDSLKFWHKGGISPANRNWVKSMCRQSRIWSKSESSQTIVYLPLINRTSQMSSPGESDFTIGATFIVKQKLCPKCPKLTEVSDPTLFKSSGGKISSFKDGYRSMCDARIVVKINRCSTCCCKGGFVTAGIEASLTNVGNETLKDMCSMWFTGADMVVRIWAAVVRTGEVSQQQASCYPQASMTKMITRGQLGTNPPTNNFQSLVPKLTRGNDNKGRKDRRRKKMFNFRI